MSFLPAPPRAEAPSTVAAPPASSDRIIRSDEALNLPAIRVAPVRVEIEQSMGRTHIFLHPPEITLRQGDGIEWDFRYLGGTDTFIERIKISFEGANLFSSQRFDTKNPGAARPHRLLTGRLAEGASTGTYTYALEAVDLWGNSVANARATLHVIVS